MLAFLENLCYTKQVPNARVQKLSLIHIYRSVTLANELYEALKKTDSYGVRIEHRDIGKDAITKAK